MLAEFSRRFAPGTLWGLRQAPREAAHGRRVERHWRWPTLLLLSATVPAFYAELLDEPTPLVAKLAYMLAAVVTGLALLHTAARSGGFGRHLWANPLDLLLVLGLGVSAWLPESSQSTWALMFRLGVALMTLVRMVWGIQHLITRGGLTYLLLLAATVLGLCGIGFWWLEPKAHSLADGLWLAFATAATVGYGDIVPSTPASKIFSVFVVMLGYGVLSLVTAAIATRWVETEERMIEREILRDMHRQIDSLRHEIAGLRHDLGASRREVHGHSAADDSVT
ncbi:potassium channel family protein [Aquabacterium sp. OR-4]|uniref:potassium channel family protein n=1 Tax=Aquabacterium sp. OR-4 TaxID=2978127 RepID=UPI0028C6B268|nr:potassium channel family protein [Aquabacterium sp. OR-4]MDT7834309.1 potassium channel family protein [Aquabacterium sp. OR-4]